MDVCPAAVGVPKLIMACKLHCVSLIGKAIAHAVADQCVILTGSGLLARHAERTARHSCGSHR